MPFSSAGHRWSERILTAETPEAVFHRALLPAEAQQVMLRHPRRLAARTRAADPARLLPRALVTINGFPVPTRHSQRREIDATAAADNADGAVWLQATRGKRARRDVARADVMHLLKEIDDLRDTEPMNPEARRPRYRNGNIERLSPLSASEETELLIVVLDREGRTGIPSETLKRSPSTSEEAFRALGMASFADDGDDQDVDWEEVFDVQAR